MNSNIEVAIVEDDADIRQLMQLIVDGSPGFRCRHTFASVEEGVPALLASPADVLLMDIDLPQLSGIEGVKWLKKEKFPGHVIMLTVHEDDEAVFDSICAGAIGYLVKGLPPIQLLSAITEAYEGGSPMSSAIARKVVRSFQAVQHNPLSEREREVLKLLCEGENYRSIADVLFVSSNTVKAHIKNIYEKLQVHTRAEAVGKAIRDKLL